MPSSASSSPRADPWAWLQAALLAANLAWTTLCLGGYLPRTLVVTATLTLALLDAPGVALSEQVQLWVGIVLIGILNFGVSFLCSFAMATRARAVNSRLQRRLFRRSLVRFLKNPFFFLLPL